MFANNSIEHTNRFPFDSPTTSLSSSGTLNSFLKSSARDLYDGYITLYQAFFLARSVNFDPDGEDDFFESFDSSCDLQLKSDGTLNPSDEYRAS